MNSFRRAPALALSLASFLTQFDLTAVVVAMPSIGADLGFGVAGYAWVMDAYSLAFTATLLASGALADRYGRRRVLLSGNALFAAASLACGFAWDGPSLWAARAAQGVSSAFVVTGSLALIAGAYPDLADRARAFGLAGIVAGMAMALGPTLGGGIAAWCGWRWIFIANLPFCLFGAWIIPRLIPEAHADASRPFDLPGIVLLTLALGTAIETLLAGRTLLPVLAGIGTSLGLAAMLVAQQRRRKQPILDPSLLVQRAMIAVALLLITVSIGYWSVLVYLPLFVTAAFGLSVEQSGIVLLAATLPMVILPPLAGHLATRWGWRGLFTTGLAIIAAGDIALATASSFALTIVGMVVIATGAALVQSQLSGAVVTLAPPAQAGMASALTIVMRQGGFAVGIALLGSALGAGQGPQAYAVAFAIAACAATVGACAALMLLPRRAPRPLS